jgi:hypothetical protein
MPLFNISRDVVLPVGLFRRWALHYLHTAVHALPSLLLFMRGVAAIPQRPWWLQCIAPAPPILCLAVPHMSSGPQFGSRLLHTVLQIPSDQGISFDKTPAMKAREVAGEALLFARTPQIP